MVATGRSAHDGTMSSVSDSDEERGVVGGLAGGDLAGKAQMCIGGAACNQWSRHVMLKDEGML